MATIHRYILAAVLLFALACLGPTLGVFNWSISSPIKLGLDLKGGVHLVYSLDKEELKKNYLKNTARDIRAIMKEKKYAIDSIKTSDKIEVTFLSARTKENAVKELALSDSFEISQGEKNITFILKDETFLRLIGDATLQSIETIRNRVDKFGVAEPLISKVGESRILLEMPGIKNVDDVKALVGRVARLEFRLVSKNSSADGVKKYSGNEGEEYYLEPDVLIGGESVADAKVATSQYGQPEVDLSFNSSGSSLFAKVTSANINRNLAIVLDNVVYSAPTIQEGITGGKARISGNFTYATARDLAIVLKSGALPASLRVVEERNVGATLGEESIRNGINAVIAGLIFISLFMVIYYKKSGVIAVCSLFLNLLVVLACLSILGATLTLPGIAGLLLTVGMAVDSNVIIFERIRDFIKESANLGVRVTPYEVIEKGFARAGSAITDTNITGLLSGCILYWLGSGPIKGFAVTTNLGLVATLFCAVYAARVMFDLMPFGDEVSI